MSFIRYIAARYLLSKKSRNVVNIISRVALIGIMVGTMALTIVLSVFNGFDDLIQSFFSVFDPELKITAAEGKYFTPQGAAFDSIRNHPDVAYFADEVEEIAHLRFEDHQYIANIKGVDDRYIEMSRIDSFIYDGKMKLADNSNYYTVIGHGVAYNLGIAVNFVRPIYISVPKKGETFNSLSNPFRQKYLFLSGVYSVGQQEVDDKYAIISIDVARELLDLDKNEVTAVALKLRSNSNVKSVQKELKQILGDTYIIENRYQQHESYYRVAESERLFIFITFAFILIIASFNLAGSLSMQIIDKKKDIHILQSFGATRKQISQIFFFEGCLVSVIGTLAGIVLGVIICIGQQQFGWIKMPGGFAVTSYPVSIRLSSLLIIAITVLIIGAFISWLPIKFMPKKFFEISQD